MKFCCAAYWCDPPPSPGDLTWRSMFLTWGADGPGLTKLPSARYQPLQLLLLIIAHGIRTASCVNKWLLFAILIQSNLLLLMIKLVNGDNHSYEFFSWWSFIKKKNKFRDLVENSLMHVEKWMQVCLVRNFTLSLVTWGPWPSGALDFGGGWCLGLFDVGRPLTGGGIWFQLRPGTRLCSG